MYAFAVSILLAIGFRPVLFGLTYTCTRVTHTAVCLQEAVKVLTQQYVPLNNTFVYNGVASTGGSYQL